MKRTEICTCDEGWKGMDKLLLERYVLRILGQERLQDG